MLRRAASGHIEATQLPKFAAASRIALAVIRGWPEAPSSPLHGGAAPLPAGAGCGDGVDFCPEKMLPSRLEIPSPLCGCASASPASNNVPSAAAIVAVLSRVPVMAIIDFTLFPKALPFSAGPVAVFNRLAERRF